MGRIPCTSDLLATVTWRKVGSENISKRKKMPGHNIQMSCQGRMLQILDSCIIQTNAPSLFCSEGKQHFIFVALAMEPVRK